MNLKIITLNIWHGGRLFDNVVEFLSRENPDILLMQEVMNEHNPKFERRFRTIDELIKIADWKDFDFAPACKVVLPEGDLQIGNAILTKIPISKRFEPVFFNNPYSDKYYDVPGNYQNAPRNLQHIVVDIDGTLLHVANLQGTWDLEGENDSPDRLKMSQAMVDVVKGLDYAVLGGDTNVRPSTQTIRNVEQHMTNVFKGELKTTFNVSQKTDPKLKAGYATSVVDMLFVSPEIKVVEHYCPEVTISDHLPLVMIIELP